MGQVDFSEITSVYLDTNLYIYFFENNHTFADTVESLFTDILGRQIPIVASELVRTELLVLPYKTEATELIDIYTQLETHISVLQFIPLTKDISEKTAQLRAKYTITTPDAIHLATAMYNNVSLFLTTDAKLSKIKGVRVQQLPLL